MIPVLFFLAQASASPDCYDSAKTQLDLDSCASAQLAEARSALAAFNKTYKARLAPEQAALFDSAQTRWAAYSQTFCEFKASGVLGGSAYPMVLDRCLALETGAWLAQLRTLSKCGEGDYECPSFGGLAPNNSFKPNPLRGSA